MTKLTNKYVIGTHVMFFEIEMYKDFIDGLVNLLETVAVSYTHLTLPTNREV